VQLFRPRLLVALDLWITLRVAAATSDPYATVRVDSPTTGLPIRRYLHDSPRTALRTERRVRTNVVALLGILLTDAVDMGLDRAKAVEIVEDLTVMRDSDGPGHNYVDISSPTKTLVLSRDEYVRVVPPS
jgi:hypothetical protein